MIAAVVGVTALGALRRSLAVEIGLLSTSSEVGSGLVTSVFDEIRSAEQYLTGPTPQARDEFQATADSAFSYQRRLDGLAGLTESDRILVNRIKQLQAAIHVDYSMAHALLDLGRTRAAVAQAGAARGPAAHLTRLVRELAARQSDKAAQAGRRLAALATGR